ncbi:MAG: hypothetical protein ACYS9X_05450 [Planctomycetota bacterium]|jgi:hypothetical protein
MVKIYPEPREVRFSEWALQLMSPRTTTVALVISLVVGSVSLLAHVWGPGPGSTDPRIERRRTLQGYGDDGMPIYDLPDPEIAGRTPVLGMAIGLIMSTSFGVLLLGQLVGLARKAAAGDDGKRTSARRSRARPPREA